MNRFEFYSNLQTYKSNEELSHYGIIGQKWGKRRWQNSDGTFNEAGKERYFGTKGKKEKNEKKINSKYQNKDGSLSQEYINKIQKLTNEGKFDEIEKLKKQIDFDKVQEWSKKANPNLYKIPDFSDPSEYEGDFESYVEDNWETAAKKRGFDPDDLTDEQGKIIDKDMKDYFNSNEEKIGSMSDKEIKRLNKEAKKIEKDFMTKSKYDNHKYIDSDKVDEWLDKDERNKKVEESYEQIMNKAYGEKSKQIQEMFKDYDDDNKRYVSEAGMNQAINFGNNTMGDISWNAKWFIGDDGDQANGNSHAYYLAKKGYNFKQINEMFNEADKAYEEGKEVGRKISQYGNPVILQMSDKVQERIYDQISSRYNKKDGYTWGKLGEASEGGYEKDGSFDKNVMKDVDNISKKLKSSCGNKNSNGWWYFNEAVDNLGMGNINYKDMTQSDWNRLNDEINRLKSK